MVGIAPWPMDKDEPDPAQALLFQIEPFIAMRMAQPLMAAGYWVAVATSVEQALAKLETPGARFQALVADLADGPPDSVQRLVWAARRRFPAIHVVCVGEPPPRCGVYDLLTCDSSAEALTALMLKLKTGPAVR